MTIPLTLSALAPNSKPPSFEGWNLVRQRVRWNINNLILDELGYTLAITAGNIESSEITGRKTTFLVYYFLNWLGGCCCTSSTSRSASGYLKQVKRSSLQFHKSPLMSGNSFQCFGSVLGSLFWMYQHQLIK